MNKQRKFEAQTKRGIVYAPARTFSVDEKNDENASEAQKELKEEKTQAEEEPSVEVKEDSSNLEPTHEKSEAAQKPSTSTPSESAQPEKTKKMDKKTLKQRREAYMKSESAKRINSIYNLGFRS